MNRFLGLKNVPLFIKREILDMLDNADSKKIVQEELRHGPLVLEIKDSKEQLMLQSNGDVESLIIALKEQLEPELA